MEVEAQSSEAFRYAVTVQWSEEDAVYVARVPALGIGCAAHGDSLQDAVREVRVAADLILDVMREAGDAIPDPWEDEHPARKADET